MLRTLDGVVDAAVRLGGDGRLKGFIVRDDAADPDLLSARIDQAIADRLAGPERPKSIRFGHALPRDALGKLADWD
jgi:4-coumarate--CoA ligase